MQLMGRGGQGNEWEHGDEPRESGGVSEIMGQQEWDSMRRSS